MQIVAQCVLEIKTLPAQEIFLEVLEQEPKLPLHAREFVFSAPRNAKYLRRFLRSHAVLRIGPKLARVLAVAFPKNLFSILNNNPEKLLEIEGIGKKKLQQVIESWSYCQQKIEF